MRLVVVEGTTPSHDVSSGGRQARLDLDGLGAGEADHLQVAHHLGLPVAVRGRRVERRCTRGLKADRPTSPEAAHQNVRPGAPTMELHEQIEPALEVGDQPLELGRLGAAGEPRDDRIGQVHHLVHRTARSPDDPGLPRVSDQHELGTGETRRQGPQRRDREDEVAEAAATKDADPPDRVRQACNGAHGRTRATVLAAAPRSPHNPSVHGCSTDQEVPMATQEIKATNLAGDDRKFLQKHSKWLSKSTLRAKWIHSGDEHEDRKGQTLATREPDVIRSWAEARDAKPATVGRQREQPRTLRFDFQGNGGRLRTIDWDAWLRTFQDRDLVFLYQEHRRDGRESNFFRLDSPEREDG